MLFILILEKGSVYNDRDIIIIGVFRNRQDADKCKKKHEDEDYKEEYRNYYLVEIWFVYNVTNTFITFDKVV